jgi:DNA-binding NarL/FixJ family response regulator
VIRVLQVDDHAAFRQPLAFMLNREPDITVVGQAGTLAEACTMLTGVDVAIVDLDLPDGNGVDLVRSLHEVSPQTKVLILTGSSSRTDQARAVEAGASGVLHKSARIEEIIDAVKRLGAGENILSLQETIELLRLASRRREEDREAQVALRQLTRRERDVLQALARGLGDKEIAQELHVSTETVRTHMVNILNKLGVDSRLQALVFAVRYGVVSID